MGGTLQDATIAAGTALVASSASSTLNDVTLSGSLHIQQNYLLVTDTAQTGSGLTLKGGTILTDSYTSLVFAGTQTLGGSGTLTADYNSIISLSGTSQTLTIAPGITIQSSGGALDVGSNSLINQGTLSGDATVGIGSGFTVNGTNWVNDGTIQGINGGYINLTGSWTNDAPNPNSTPPTNPQITANDGKVSLNGSWTNQGTLSLLNNGILNLGGTLTLATLGKLSRDATNPGTLGLIGTLNLGSQTLDATHGTWTLASGSTISGGTISASLLSTGYPSILNDVALSGSLHIQQNYLVVTDTAQTGSGLTLKGGTILLDSFDNLIFAGTQTLGGSGTLTADYNSVISLSGTSQTLTIGPDITIKSSGGVLDVGSNSLINQGTLSGDATVGVGSGFTVNGTNWVNDGTIQGVNGGYINLTGSWTNDAPNPNSTPPTNPQITANDGKVSLNGSWTNQGTLSLLNNGTLNLGGTLTLATLGKLSRDATNPGTLGLIGTLNLGSQTLDSTHGTWTLASGSTISGGTISASLLSTGYPSHPQRCDALGILAHSAELPWW